jgi:20S proteasome alpha/beta subunit
MLKSNCYLIANISLFYYKLTLILGARCIDGVVIVGDSKITDVMGTLLRYEPKYAGALRNVLFGYSGVVHMFQVFERYVVGDVVILRDSKDKYTPENLLEKISDAMHVLFEARSNQYFDLRVMVGRQFPKDGNSDLHIVDSCGNIDQVRSWSAIGNGESIAKPIVQTRWKENMTMREFANISCRVIKGIEKRNLENSVGGNPWVRYQEDGADLDIEPNDEEYKKLIQGSDANT